MLEYIINGSIINSDTKYQTFYFKEDDKTIILQPTLYTNQPMRVELYIYKGEIISDPTIKQNIDTGIIKFAKSFVGTVGQCEVSFIVIDTLYKIHVSKK